MARGKHKIYRVTMLLLIAASFAFIPKFASAAKEETALPDAESVAALHAAVGLPPPAAKGKRAAVGASTRTADGDAASPPSTAAYAASVLRYRLGYLSALPDGAGNPAVPTAAETEAAIGRLMRGELAFDIEPYVQQMRGKQTRLYRTYAENARVFIEMCEMVRTRTERAVQKCLPAVRRDIAMTGAALQLPPAPYNLPGWKSLAALYYVYGADTLDMLYDSLAATLVETGDGNVTVRFAFGAHDDLAAMGTRKQFVQARFALAYLNTAFDDTGAAKAAEKRVYDEAYLATVAHPVPGYLIKDGWFDPRDRGTRLHMGTDIRAPGGTRILSVTDGTVLYVGYLPIPGNYVIVRDPSGYEYHYYHLRERTQFVREGDIVRQGDVIGRVGNTGNSAANHLHVTIVSPEYVYVNPYDLLRQAGLSPIRLDA